MIVPKIKQRVDADCRECILPPEPTNLSPFLTPVSLLPICRPARHPRDITNCATLENTRGMLSGIAFREDTSPRKQHDHSRRGRSCGGNCTRYSTYQAIALQLFRLPFAPLRPRSRHTVHPRPAQHSQQCSF